MGSADATWAPWRAPALRTYIRTASCQAARLPGLSHSHAQERERVGWHLASLHALVIFTMLPSTVPFWCVLADIASGCHGINFHSNRQLTLASILPRYTTVHGILPPPLLHRLGPHRYQLYVVVPPIDVFSYGQISSTCWREPGNLDCLTTWTTPTGICVYMW